MPTNDNKYIFIDTAGLRKPGKREVGIEKFSAIRTLAAIEEALVNGEKVSITGFGTFEVRQRGEKTCINPKTKEKMVCPPSKAPAFKAGKALKESINK